MYAFSDKYFPKVYITLKMLQVAVEKKLLIQTIYKY